MAGNGTRHHSTYGKFVGHGVTPLYHNVDGASFDIFHGGGVDNYSNTSIMLYIDSISKCLDQWIPGFSQNGNIIPAILYENCPPEWKEKFDLSHFNSILGCFSAWSCFYGLTQQFHQDPDCSYTIIGVPHDDCPPCLHPGRGRGSFQFSWDGNEFKFFDIELSKGTIMYYAGYTIHHRQSIFDHGYFFNVACYHDKRFLQS